MAENGAIMKQKLEALVGVVPGLLRAEVGVGFNGYDVALYTELEDRAALRIRGPSAHCKVKEFVHSVICETRAVITRHMGPPHIRPAAVLTTDAVKT